MDNWFSPKSDWVILFVNNRSFLADLVLSDWMVEINLKFLLKIKKNSY